MIWVPSYEYKVVCGSVGYCSTDHNRDVTTVPRKIYNEDRKGDDTSMSTGDSKQQRHDSECVSKT
jgi:hypothetical protein